MKTVSKKKVDRPDGVQWLEVKVGENTARLTAVDFSWLCFLSRLYELLGRSEAEACFEDAAWRTARWVSQVIQSARAYAGEEKPFSMRNAKRQCERVATFARSYGLDIHLESVEENRIVFKVKPGLQKNAHDLGLLQCVACPILKGWLGGTTSLIKGFEENDVHKTVCIYNGARFCRFEVLKRILVEGK